MNFCRSISIIVLLILASVNLSGQSADSLSTHDPVADTATINRLNLLALDTASNDPAATKALANQALRLAQKIKYEKGISDAWQNLGVYYQLNGDMVKSLDYYLRSLRIRERLDDKFAISQSLNSIGNLYFQQKDDALALEHYEKALEIRKGMHDKKGIGSLLNNIANIYYRREEYDNAISKYKESLVVNQEIKHQAGEAINLFNIGLIYAKKKEYSLALNHFWKSLKIRTDLNHPSGISGCYHEIGNVYYETEEYDKSLRYQKKAMESAEDSGDKSRIKNAYDGLSKAFFKTGDLKNAALNLSAFVTLKDSLVNTENARQIARVQAGYESEKEEREQELAIKEIEINKEQELSQQKDIRNSVMVGAFILLIVVVVFFMRFRIKNKATDFLEKKVDERTAELKLTNDALESEVDIRKQKEAKLENLYKEMNTFVYKSSHDLKSPLTTIRGLVNIAQAEKKDAGSLVYLDEIDNKMIHLDTMLANLLKHVARTEMKVDKIPVDVYQVISSAVDNLENHNNRIHLDFKTTENIISDKEALCVIVNIVLSEAINRSDTSSTIDVSVNKLNEKMLITVCDSGAVFPEKLKEQLLGGQQGGTIIFSDEHKNWAKVIPALKKLEAILIIDKDSKNANRISIQLPVG